MGEAVVFGVIASSALVVGSVVGTRLRLSERVLAFMLAFASGALMSALAFELFEDAYEKSGAWVAGFAFVAGAGVFVGVSSGLDRWIARAAPGPRPPKIEREVATEDARASQSSRSAGAGFALLAAVTLDGVPENVALGISLTEETGGIALLLAIFASNFPEALVGAAAMQESGRTAAFAVAIWTAAGILLAVAVVAGQAVFPADPEAVSIPLAFAGGAVIASLADTLMPEAFEGGGPTVAFATVAGFLLSYVLSTV